MTPIDANKAIYQRWMQQWHLLAGGTQNAPTVPYAIDNRTRPQGAERFAVVSIVSLDCEQVTLGRAGSRKFQWTGWIDVKLVGPPDEGRGPLDLLAHYVKQIFGSTRIGPITDTEHGITTYTTTVNELRGDKEFPGLWVLLVRTPFDFYERR